MSAIELEFVVDVVGEFHHVCLGSMWSTFRIACLCMQQYCMFVHDEVRRGFRIFVPSDCLQSSVRRILGLSIVELPLVIFLLVIVWSECSVS